MNEARFEGVLPDAESPPPRVASLGRLPFSLSADELRQRGAEILAEERHQLADLASRSSSATVAGFLEPLNRILVAVRDVGAHGGLLFQAHPSPEIRAAGRELSEDSDRFFNEFRLNEAVYRHLRSIDLSDQDPTTGWGLERLLKEMRRAGVEQPVPRRKEIVDLANELDQVENEFSVNISSAVRSVVTEGEEPLRGLPADFIATHAPGADGKIRITTRYPDVFPVMSYADDADLRRRLYHEFMNVAAPENLRVLHDLLVGRRKFVRLLGYSDYAQYAVEDKMSEHPEVVETFLDRVRNLVREPSSREMARLLARKQKDQPEATRLEEWDGPLVATGYYGTKIRQEEYGVDARRLRAYLPYTAVRDGLFELCRELFGLEFRRDRTPELWHPTVEAYDVGRKGEPMGRCYFDFVPRPGKFTHAAHFTVRTGVMGGGLPQGALICNFLDDTTPVEEARMEYRDVVTFFHEFGHLLHNLLSGHGHWVYSGMGSVERDFIEAPSQLFEEWARDPATLARFARNPDTGEPIPTALVARLKESEAMGRASFVLRQSGLARVSLEVHLRDPNGFDTSELYREIFSKQVGVPVDPEYHAMASFGHLTGYSAFYYTYLWSAVIARDLLTPLEAKGSLTDRVLAERYANEVLAPGGSRPAAELVRNFLGREYNFDAFSRWALAGTKPP
ncbi:MAG: M3 family metallopeptidase [Thermoplasmata archaeon]